jgi:predicted transcriptional regulator
MSTFYLTYALHDTIKVSGGVYMELKEWAKLQEELLRSQIGVIRVYLRSVEPGVYERKTPQRKSKSQINIIHDILLTAKTPLHVSEIIRRANDQFGVALDRESVVSALTKKVKKGATFIRTSPNTFALKEL